MRLRTIDKKVLRDLIGQRGPAGAIALVIMCGVATFVMALSTRVTLERTRRDYYRAGQFADVFANLVRAPEQLAARIAEIPGVVRVETRVSGAARLEVGSSGRPLTAQLVSLPRVGQPELNRLHLRLGSLPDSDREGEVVVSEAFAEANRLRPGAQLAVIIHGRRRVLEVCGWGLAPDFIFPIAPGSIVPDFTSHAIIWMARPQLAAALDLDGSFNEVALSIVAGTRAEDVISSLDGLLEPYGGRGAYARSDQPSHRYLSEEMRQLATMATLFPCIFMSVAAFLLNVVASRLVATQREQLAALKAFGYPNLAIGLHYLKTMLSIVVVGVAAGIVAGAYLGDAMSHMYMKFYRFPSLHYWLEPWIALAALGISALAATGGVAFSVRRAVTLPPAQALRPEPPARYRRALFERFGFGLKFAQTTRMILRHLERRPVRTLLSLVGLGFGSSVLVVGMCFEDSVANLIRRQYGSANREDLVVSFVEPVARSACFDLRAVRGVTRVETTRTVAVRLVAGHRRHRTTIQAFEPGADLHRLLDRELRPIEMPQHGLVLTQFLAEMLAVKPGDLLTVEVLDGTRPVREVVLAGLVQQFVGVGAYMDLTALNRVMRDGDLITGAFLAVDPLFERDALAELRGMPRIAGTVSQQNELESLVRTMQQQLLIFATFNIVIAVAIAFGVVYNSARISLAETERELASLRVLGFTRGEVAAILLGELALLTLASIPLGLLIGRGLSAFMFSVIETELFRVPLVIEPSTEALAATVMILSAVISALVVTRRLSRLDLVAVLKSKE
ncbi:MAG: ABC transporter permease [Planctomycetota bacterium]